MSNHKYLISLTKKGGCGYSRAIPISTSTHRRGGRRGRGASEEVKICLSLISPTEARGGEEIKKKGSIFQFIINLLPREGGLQGWRDLESLFPIIWEGEA